MDNGNKAFEAEHVQRVELEGALEAAVNALRPFQRLEAIARFHGHGLGSTCEWSISYDDLRTAAMVVTSWEASNANKSR